MRAILQFFVSQQWLPKMYNVRSWFNYQNENVNAIFHAYYIALRGNILTTALLVWNVYSMEKEAKKNCHKTLHAKQSAKRPTSPPEKSERFSRNSYRIHLEPFSMAEKQQKGKIFGFHCGRLRFWRDEVRYARCDSHTLEKATSIAHLVLFVGNFGSFLSR